MLRTITFIFPFLLAMPRAQSITCLGVDFRVATNQELESMLALSLYEAKVFRPITCGLPGESLNICSRCDNEFSEESLQVIRPVYNTKSHKDWHRKWHDVREKESAIRKAGQEYFRKLVKKGVLPEDESLDSFYAKYGKLGRLSGENFFYMHRTMLKSLQFELTANQLPCLAPWKTLPPKVDDPFWPVPKSYNSSVESIEDKITDQAKLDELRDLLHETFYNKDYLQNRSLNQVGQHLERTLHQELHSFYRSESLVSPEALKQGFNDDLLPPQSSPLNKYFWKLHSLVDEVLGAWLKHNGYDEIGVNCRQKSRCYKWEGTWLGPYRVN